MKNLFDNLYLFEPEENSLKLFFVTIHLIGLTRPNAILTKIRSSQIRVWSFGLSLT